MRFFSHKNLIKTRITHFAELFIVQTLLWSCRRYTYSCAAVNTGPFITPHKNWSSFLVSPCILWLVKLPKFSYSRSKQFKKISCYSKYVNKFFKSLIISFDKLWGFSFTSVFMLKLKVFYYETTQKRHKINNTEKTYKSIIMQYLM